MFRSQTLQRLSRLLRVLPSRRKKAFLCGVLPASILSGLTDLASVAVAARLSGSLVGSNLRDSMPGVKVFNTSIDQQAIYLILILVGLSWSSSILKLLRLIFVKRLASQVWRDVSDLLLGRVVGQPYDYFITAKSASISSQILLNVQGISTAITEPTLLIISSSIVLVSIAIALIISIGMKAIILLLILGSLFLLISSSIVPYMRLASKQKVRLDTLTNSLLNQIISSIKDIHLTQSASYFESRFIKAGEEAKQFQWKSNILPDFPRILIEPLAITFIFGVALFPLITGTAKGDLASNVIPFVATFVVAAAKLTPPLQDLFRSITTLRGALPQIDSALSYLDLPKSKRGYLSDDVVSPDGIFPRREISLHNIGYKYPDSEHAALRSISINVPVGSRIALMGPTGSGKSTLSNILLAHLEPTTGQMRLDGIPLEVNDISSWQRCCSEVPQNISLLDSSILENIAFGFPEEMVDLDQVWDAIASAQLYDLVTDMPHGLYTSVGENGINLSGGQRQRLALARVFYRKSKFLILDEATSSLDEKTESDVINSLEIIGRRCTTVVIAHRLNTLAKCDYIYEINNGLVVASGKYQNLMDLDHPLGNSVKV